MKVATPPASCVSKTSPWQDRGARPSRRTGPAVAVGTLGCPRTPAQRAAATDRLLERTGLAGRVTRWRAVALLAHWWTAEGACVAALLHALDHHPDHPDRPRGDALRAARDPLAVLAYRLTPWAGRLAELPPELRAVDGDERRRRARSLTATSPVAESAQHREVSSPAVRAAARRAFAATRAGRGTRSKQSP